MHIPFWIYVYKTQRLTLWINFKYIWRIGSILDSMNNWSLRRCCRNLNTYRKKIQLVAYLHRRPLEIQFVVCHFWKWMTNLIWISINRCCFIQKVAVLIDSLLHMLINLKGKVFRWSWKTSGHQSNP